MTIPCHPLTLLHKPVEAIVTIYRRMGDIPHSARHMHTQQCLTRIELLWRTCWQLEFKM